MSLQTLGKTLVIANPAAHSGRGAEGAKFCERFLQSYTSATAGFDLVRTTGPRDAELIASQARAYDTVVVLGGDGVIHESVVGLMKIDKHERPQLAVIPYGSGNDFARTLGMQKNDVEKAFAQILQGTPQKIDIGMVNGLPFVQTLSFGLDGAIARDTMERRAKDSSCEGESLFITSSIRLLAQARSGYRCQARFDDEGLLDIDPLFFAIQLGPTYGGGFEICPDADPYDGLLDTCYNTKMPSLPKMMQLLVALRFGAHKHSKAFAFKRFKKLELIYDEVPPAQIDGEFLEDTHFTIEVLPQALTVIVPPQKSKR